MVRWFFVGWSFGFLLVGFLNYCSYSSAARITVGRSVGFLCLDDWIFADCSVGFLLVGWLDFCCVVGWFVGFLLVGWLKWLVEFLLLLFKVGTLNK